MNYEFAFPDESPRKGGSPGKGPNKINNALLFHTVPAIEYLHPTLSQHAMGNTDHVTIAGLIQ